VRRARPDPLEEARAAAIEAMIDPRPLENDQRTQALIGTAERAGAAGDRELHSAARRCPNASVILRRALSISARSELAAALAADASRT
jgi:hypothetical protein